MADICSGAGSCSGSGGANGFYCQHRWTPVANMVKFRTAVGGAGLVNWQTGSNQQIAFGRGNAGFVAINNADSAWSVTVRVAYVTSLAARLYSSSSTPNSRTARTAMSFLAAFPAAAALVPPQLSLVVASR
jgi:hypothetical protein